MSILPLLFFSVLSTNAQFGLSRTFFSTDDQFPPQIHQFDGATSSEFDALKERVTRLEQLLEGLHEHIIDKWNTTESGSRYRLFEERKNWEAAEKECQSYGAHLAVIDNGAKNSYAKDLLNESETADFVWIGMKTKTMRDSSTFTNFASDSPIDGCAVIDKKGIWSIRSCVQLRPFLCQIVKSI